MLFFFVFFPAFSGKHSRPTKYLITLTCLSPVILLYLAMSALKDTVILEKMKDNENTKIN